MQSERELFAIYNRLDGLLFTGGADINPRRYGQEPIPACQPPDDAKDHVELRLARWALEDNKPIMAICRGMQLLNVAANGTLYQDLALQYSGALRHNRGDIRQTIVHPVRLEPGSRLAAIMGSSEIGVNSSHHQAVKEPGRLFEVVGHASDGVIEAMESLKHRFVLAVQWHPEELCYIEPIHKALFDAVVIAAGQQ
jgi:putative glutamine amidotransferase